MSISGIPSNVNPYSTSATSNRNSFRADFSALASALNAGDLSGAQSAFSALQSLQPGRFGNSSSAGGATSANSASPINTDIAALSKALQSGDLTGAQTAFKKVQQDMGSVQRGHHHHHKQGGEKASSQDMTTVDPTADPLLDGQSGLVA
jgi:hypothetical protein